MLDFYSCRDFSPKMYTHQFFLIHSDVIIRIDLNRIHSCIRDAFEFVILHIFNQYFL
jgi:hypothetical protein